MDNKELSSLDKVLIENVALMEENAALRAELSKYQIMEKKIGVRQYIAEKFKVNLETHEFSVDLKKGLLSVAPKNNNVSPV